MQDTINGMFELIGAPFIFLSIMKVYSTKSSKGVNWMHPTYFTAWGVWNLYYYPWLEQWTSFWGCVAITIANIIWVFGLIKYRRQ